MTQVSVDEVQQLKEKLERGVPDGILLEILLNYKVDSADFGPCNNGTLQEAVEEKFKCEEASGILALLPRAVDVRSTFANGGGYIQHPHEAVEIFAAAVRIFVDKYYAPIPTHNISKKNVLEDFDKKSHPLALLRQFEEHDRIVAKLYERLCCIDELGREWGQVGFALKSHPHWTLREDKEWTNIA